MNCSQLNWLRHPLMALLIAVIGLTVQAEESQDSEEVVTKTVEVEVVTETITLPLSEKTINKRGDLPKRGASEQSVAQQYGEPDESFPARGNPPISRWVYPEFTVYFESGWVIHSVLKPKQ